MYLGYEHLLTAHDVDTALQAEVAATFAAVDAATGGGENGNRGVRLGHYFKEAFTGLDVERRGIGHFLDAGDAVGVLLAFLLVDAYPVEVGLVGVGHIGVGRPGIVAHRLVEDEVKMLVEGPLALVEVIAVARLGVAGHLLSVHVPSQFCLAPLQTVSVIVVHLDRLVERRTRITGLSQVVGPVGVNSMVGHVRSVNHFPDVYLAAVGPSGTLVFGHHPDGREVAGPRI